MAPRNQKPHLARVDAATPESGLFKVRPKSASRLKAEEFSTVVRPKDGPPIEVKYATPYALDDVDLRIYLAAVGLCAQEPDKVNKKSKDPTQKTLWDKFLPTHEALDSNGAYARTTSYALASAAGLGWGKNVPTRVTESLEKMSHVFSTWRIGSRVMSGARMISYAHDEESAELAIGISPLFAQAILGNAKRYIQVSLEEMRTLKHPAASVVHLVMSSRLAMYKNTKKRDLSISIDVLAETVYGPPSSPKQKRDRRASIQKAFEELDAMKGWHVLYNPETGKVNFTRNTPRSLEYMLKNVERIERELNEKEPDAEE